LREETIAKPSPTCENKTCIDEMPFVVCSATSNLGQNKKDLATHPIVKESEKGKSICAELNNVNDETHTLAVAPCEPIALMLNLSTTPASLEISLVEHVAEFPLLQDDYKIVPYDKEKLCDHASLISITQLVHEHDTYILDDTHAEVRRVHCIDSEKEELKIISSLNCLGYIKFDFVCDLNYLENELFQKSGLLYLDYCTFHAIGLYDNNNDSENRLLPNNVMMIRNYGGDKEGLKERCGGAKEQQRRLSQVGVTIQVELKSNSNFHNSLHQNHHPDHIPTPFWVFFIWMER
jgi:hypothetical protein